MLPSALAQLDAWKSDQHLARTSVEAHMSTYQAARAAYHAAQEQEAELRARLQAAEAHTKLLGEDFSDAEALLREAVIHLSRTQLCCHALERRIAEYVRCQRAAVLLLPLPLTAVLPPPPLLDATPSATAPTASLTMFRDGSVVSQSPFTAESLPLLSLLPMDPYSLLLTSSGEDCTFDLVRLVPSARRCDAGAGSLSLGYGYAAAADDDSGSDDGAPQRMPAATPSMKSGHREDVAFSAAEGTREGSGEDDAVGKKKAAAAVFPRSPTLRGLLTDVARDSLRGYHYTVLCTSCSSKNSGGERLRGFQSDYVDPTLLPHRMGERPTHLCLRLLNLLHREAKESRARSLDMTIGVGGVRATRAAAPVAGSPSVWVDLLHPKAVRQGQLTTTTNAVPPDRNDRAAAASITLQNVRIYSAEDAARWLQEVMVCLPPDSGVSAGAVREDAREARAAATPHHQTPLPPPSSLPSAAISQLLILVTVDTQDAAGQLHSSLLRIICDDEFDLTPLPPKARMEARGPQGSTPSSPISPTRSYPPCLAFAAYLCSAMNAVVRVAAQAAPDSGLPASVEGEEWSWWPEYPLSWPQHSKDLTSLTARAVQAAVRTVPSRCPKGLLVPSTTSPRHTEAGDTAGDMDRAWTLWVALLGSIFGGNSKALWLHHLTCGGDSAMTGQSAGSAFPTRAEGVLTSAARNSSAVLRLCALFCGLVRHDAVPSEMSADFSRLCPSIGPARGSSERY